MNANLALTILASYDNLYYFDGFSRDDTFIKAAKRLVDNGEYRIACFLTRDGNIKGIRTRRRWVSSNFRAGEKELLELVRDTYGERARRDGAYVARVMVRRWKTCWKF